MEGKKKWKKRDIRWQVVGGDNDPSQSPRVLTKNSWQTPASGSSAVGFRCLFFYSSALIPMHCLCLALLSIPSATEHNWKNKNPRLSTRHVQKKSKLLKSFLTLMRTQAVIPPHHHPRWMQARSVEPSSLFWIGECMHQHQVYFTLTSGNRGVHDALGEAVTLMSCPRQDSVSAFLISRVQYFSLFLSSPFTFTLLFSTTKPHMTLLTTVCLSLLKNQSLTSSHGR